MDVLVTLGEYLASRPQFRLLLATALLYTIVSDDLDRQVYNREIGLLNRPFKLFSAMVNRARDVVWMVLFLYLGNWSITQALAALPVFLVVNPGFRFVWFLIPWHLFRMYTGAAFAIGVQLLLPRSPLWGWYTGVVTPLQPVQVWVAILLIGVLISGAAIGLLMRLIPEDQRIIQTLRELLAEEREPQPGVNVITIWWNNVILYAFERANRYWFAGGAILEWLITYLLTRLIKLLVWPIDKMLGWNK